MRSTILYCAIRETGSSVGPVNSGTNAALRQFEPRYRIAHQLKAGYIVGGSVIEHNYICNSQFEM